MESSQLLDIRIKQYIKMPRKIPLKSSQQSVVPGLMMQN